MKKLCILYLCDFGLHNETLLSIASLAKNAKAPLDILFYQVGYQTALPLDLNHYLNKRGHRAQVGTFRPKIEYENQLSSECGVTKTALSKFAAIESAAEEYDWVLYLDGDTLFLDDPQFDQLIGFDAPLAACLDHAKNCKLWNTEFSENCKRNHYSPHHFNTGLMLVHSKAWKAANYLARFQENVERHTRTCPYVSNCTKLDQCPANMTFSDNWKQLPSSLNVQRSAIHTELWAEATMRHYTGGRHKCIPVLRRRCDPREHRLLQQIIPICGLTTGLYRYDGGLSYALNRLRRYSTVKAIERELAEESQSPGAILSAGS